MLKNGFGGLPYFSEAEDDFPRMVNLPMPATVIFTSKVWSPGKNTIVVLEVKFSVSYAYSERVVQ